MKVLFKKMHPNAKMPYKKRNDDAGYDLFACEDILLTAKNITFVPVGIAMCLPKNYYAEIHSRSGLRKQGIFPPVGVIDQNYRGNFGVVLYNFSEKDYQVSKGDRVAQVIIKKQENVKFIETNSLPDSDRGAQGWGSSGR